MTRPTQTGRMIPAPCPQAPDAGHRAAADDGPPRRLCVFDGRLLWPRRIRRILARAGYRVTIGPPGPGDLVGLLARSPAAHRGEAVARRRGAGLLWIEAAGPWAPFAAPAGGVAPQGLLIDTQGAHFDPAAPSDLERLLATHPLDDTALLDRARRAIARMTGAEAAGCPGGEVAPPAPGYVLVIDQPRGDPAVIASGADRNRFREMLYWARESHPGARIVIASDPQTTRRGGHFGPVDCGDGLTRRAATAAPWRLFDGAVAVYTVSSPLGFAAIFAGHRPRLYGQPFYAGWGLTDDAFPLARRRRRLTRAQIFAGAMLLYPAWYDPRRNRLCTWEDAMDAPDRTFRARTA